VEAVVEISAPAQHELAAEECKVETYKKEIRNRKNNNNRAIMRA